MIPNYSLFCQIVGTLLTLDLLFYLPNAKNIFGPGYWKNEKLHSLPIIFIGLWFIASVALAFGMMTWFASFILWILFRHFYISTRWSSLFRGGGAPGFMSHHAVIFIFLFETTMMIDPSLFLQEQVLMLYRIDLGVILLCSGTYKCFSGYLKGEGMEYGLANPMWSYYFRRFKKINPSNRFFLFQDRAAALGQVLTGICLIIPPLLPIGGLLCALAFLYLMAVVRLGRLAAMMMACSLLYLPDFQFSLTVPNLSSRFLVPAPDWIIQAFKYAIWGYLLLLPLVKVTQYLNLFKGSKIPDPLQKFITFYASKIPIIMWRVFTPDVTNFFVRIYYNDPKTNLEVTYLDENEVYSYSSRKNIWKKMRFLNVTESISLTTIFTTLRYFGSDRKLFEDRLLKYARTLNLKGATQCRFEIVAIQKGSRSFEYVPVVDFYVDLVSGKIREHKRVESYNLNEAAKFSHIKETVGFGSYLPKSR